MAIVFTYDESTNVVNLLGGTSGIPATFAEWVTQDRAGTAELTTEDTPAAFTEASTLSLAYAVRPVENKALILTFTISGSAGLGAADTIDLSGDDWEGNNQTESIVIAAGDGAYASTKKYSTIDASGITFTDNAGGGFSGNLQVTQPQWGTIWDYGDGIYRLEAMLYLGNGASTYFTETNKVVIIGDFLVAGKRAFLVYGSGNFTLGAVATEGDKTTKNGCLVRVIDTDTSSTSIVEGWSGASVYLYSLKVLGSDAYAGREQFKGVITRMWNCAFDGFSALTSVSGCDVHNLSITGGHTCISASENCTFARINLTDCLYYALSTTTTVTLSNCIIRNFSSNLIRMIGAAGNTASLVDMDTDIWSIYWTGSNAGAYAYRKNTVNIHVSDKDGANLENVAVICEDQDGNTTGGFTSVNTDANGDIAEQTISRGYCDLNNADLDSDLTKDYSPHKFTLSKAGYETLILENITVDSPIVWHLELKGPGRYKLGTDTFFGDDS